MADQPADDSGQFHGGYAQPQPPQGWPPQDPAQKPAFFNPQQMAAPASGPPMFFNPASFDSAAVPPFLPQQGPAQPPQQQWDHPSYQQQPQQPTWNSHEVQNGPPHQGGYQGGANNIQQNEYSQQSYSSWQEQDLYAPPQTDPLADSRASSSFYESSGQSSTLGFTFSSENPSLNSSERTSPMLAGGDYGQGGFPYDGMDIPRDGMQQQPPSEGAALFRQPEGNSVPNDTGPVEQYFSSPGNTNMAPVPASMPQVSMFNPQFGLPEESRSTASLGQEEGSLTRELTGQEQEENIQQFLPPQNNQPPPIPNLEGSQTGQNWDFGGAPHQEMRRELTGQEDGLDSQMQDPSQFAVQQHEPQQAPPVLTVEEPTAGVPTLSPGVPTPSPGILTPSPGHSRNGSQQFDTISLSSGKDGNPSRSGSRASSLIVEGQAQPGVNITPSVSNSGTREDFDVGTRPVGDHSRSGSVDSGRSGPGVADGPPQSVAQPENVAVMERSRSGSAESGRSARSNRSVSSIPPAPPLNVPYQEGAAMERSRSGSAESGRSGSSGRPPSLSRHNRAESNDSIHSAGSNPALSAQPPLMEEQSPGDGAPSPQPTQTIRPSDVGPGDSPEGAASPDEPTQPQQGDGEPEPPPQNTRPPQARPSGHSPPPPSRPSIPNFPIFSPMEGSMAPQFPFTNNFPPAGPSMPSPIQHSATSPFQPVATRPQPFPARTEHNGFPGEGQDSTPTSGNDNDAAATGRQDREASTVVRQSSREEHHQHSRENLVEREPLLRREDMRNVGEEPRERRTSGLRDSAEGEQSIPPPMPPVQPVPTHSHHHVHHRKPEERRESTPTASLWSADVPASVPSVILAPAAPPTLTQAPSVQPHPVPMFVPTPNLPNNMQAPAAAASPPEKQQQQPPPASAMPSSAFGTPSTVAATAPTTSASTPSQQSPASNDTYRNASAPPPDSTAGGQQNVPPASTPQSYNTPPSRQTSTVSNSSYTSQPGRPAEEKSQERRNPQERQPSPSRSPRQVAGNEGEPEDRYVQRGQPPKPAGQATQPVDTRRDILPSTQTNQQPSSDGDYSRTRDYRGREGDTSYSTQEPERPSSRSSNHGSDRDWDRDRDERSHDRQDRRDSWYDQRDRRYDNKRDYYQERDYRSRSYEQDPRYARQGSYDSYYGRQESRERERPSSRQERERPSSRQGERPRSRQDYDREAYYRQYSAEYDRSGYYDQEKYRRRRDYYGRDYDSRTQRDPRYSRDYGANDPRYQEWYNYYYGRHGNSYDPRYYEYYKQQMQQQQSQSQGYDMYAYDPRYDNTYDDEQYVEDDRRSVHSSASGHSHHSQGWSGQYDDRFARDFHRDSSQAETSAYGHNSTTGYGDWYRDSYQQGISPATRTTPAKFHIPHVLARFGPGGHMIKVLPNNPADGMPAVVEVHGLETLLVNNNEVEELRSFHGPLIKGVTHKSDVIRFCQDKAAACLASTDIRDKESAALLWQLLELLCRQNGTIVGTDISELLLQGHPSMAYPQRTEAEGEDRGSQGDLSQASGTSDGTVGGTEAADIERLTQKFRELLLFGRKKDALEWAMKGGLWGHALLLASKMDSRAHANVMTRFANSLPMNDPLQTLYQLMSHRQPAAVTSCADERWGDWRPHLAMVLSNHTQRPEVDRKSIITLGDTLGSRGLLHAAHFCYLMAQANFGHYSKKASKMVLLGSSHSLPFMEFASNEAIQMTEVYEYAMTLGNAAHYILPSFQEYKFLYATRLAECGMTAQALTYCECIVSAVERAPTSFSSTLIGQLHQLSERLFWHDPQFSSLSAEEDQDYEWINSIRYMNQQVLEGALLPSSASDTPMFVGSTEPSIDGTSTPTPGETTYTGMGTPQYDPNQQQEQYEGYNTSGMDPTAYQQQGGTDSPYQQYNQQQQQQIDPNNYQPWSKPVPNDMNLMASMNSEYSTTSVATTTTDGGTEVENDVPDYYDQMAGQVSFKTLAPSSPEESPGEGPTDTAEKDSENSPRMVQQQHRGTPDSQGSHGRLRALSGSSHASTTRARSMSGSSQLSHGSQRMRRRQRTTSESSQVDIKEEPGQKKQEKVPNSRQASAKPKDSNKASQSHQGQKNSAQRSGGTSWLGGLFNKMMRGKNEIHLPDDTNKSIVWDATRGKWINQNEAEEEDAAPPPPPPKDPMPSPAGGPAPPPGNTPNRFSRRAGPTGKYVDVLNQSGTTKPAAPPPDLFPGMAPGGNAMPNLFVPTAVPTSDANEPQGSQLQGTMTQGNPQGTPAPTQAQQQQQQQPMFYNPNEPTTTAALAPPTSTSNTQAQLSRSSSMSSMSYEVSHLLKAQPQDNAAPPPADQGMAAPPQGPAAPPMFFNPSSFSGQNSPFNSPGQAPSGLGSRPRYARPR
ncbi:protein transport protein Sec16A-like isoform X2 [Branchiostoma lanceolatum]|uniref:protein transport protein Sec16A-like isoform X2 n=1 Tax=Branchiostoma lanceolatum TaxID=7740 RepID=UPI00345504AE